MAVLDAKILLRVRKSEREQIQTEAKTRGMSTNDYIRSLVLGFPMTDKLDLESRIIRLEERLGALEQT